MKLVWDNGAQNLAHESHSAHGGLSADLQHTR